MRFTVAGHSLDAARAAGPFYLSRILRPQTIVRRRGGYSPLEIARTHLQDLSNNVLPVIDRDKTGFCDRVREHTQNNIQSYTDAVRQSGLLGVRECFLDHLPALCSQHYAAHRKGAQLRAGFSFGGLIQSLFSGARPLLAKYLTMLPAQIGKYVSGKLGSSYGDVVEDLSTKGAKWIVDRIQKQSHGHERASGPISVPTALGPIQDACDTVMNCVMDNPNARAGLLPFIIPLLSALPAAVAGVANAFSAVRNAARASGSDLYPCLSTCPHPQNTRKTKRAAGVLHIPPSYMSQYQLDSETDSPSDTNSDSEEVELLARRTRTCSSRIILKVENKGKGKGKGKRQYKQKTMYTNRRGLAQLFTE